MSTTATGVSTTATAPTSTAGAGPGVSAPGRDLGDIAEAVLARAGDDEQVEVVVSRSGETEARAYEGDLESLSSAESAGVGVRVVIGDRQGFAYAGSLDEAVIDETLAQARDNAAFGDPDELVGLAEPDGVAVPGLDLYRPALAGIATEAKVERALALERAVRAADDRITGVDTAEYGDAISEAAVVTTTGIRSERASTACSVSASCLASEGAETQTGFGFSTGRELDDLDADEAAGDAARRATRLLGATKPPSGRFTVVLDPFVTAQFLAVIGGTLSGDAVNKGRSLFANRLGEAVAAPSVTLVDDPTDRRAFTAAETDGEGLASRRNPLITAGQLERFVHNAYTARRAGTTSTGSAVRSGFRSRPGVGCRALALAPGEEDQEAILARVGDGVLVTSVTGLHSGVNPVSGDFSTGAEGLAITDGVVAEPLREFTIASTLQRMLAEVVAVGADVDWLPMSAAGVSLAIGDLTISGT